MLRFGLCALSLAIHCQDTCNPQADPIHCSLEVGWGPKPMQRGSRKGIGHVPAAGLKVYAAMIDAELDERGYIVPGLGDAGDRAYNTL